MGSRAVWARRVGAVVSALLIVHFLLKWHFFHVHFTRHTPHHTHHPHLDRLDHRHTSATLEGRSAQDQEDHVEEKKMAKLPNNAPIVHSLELQDIMLTQINIPKDLDIQSTKVQSSQTERGSPTMGTDASSEMNPDTVATGIINVQFKRDEVKPKHAWGDLLPAPPASIMLTFGSKSVSEFILNWVKNVERIPGIGVYIVACMDEALLALCKSHNIPAFYARSADIIANKDYLGTDPTKQEKQTIGADRYYRTDGAAFKKMGAVKAATLQILLETGYNVFISDADVVWFGSPWPVVGGRSDVPVRADSVHLAEADILASTDCIDFLEDLSPGLVGHEQNTGMLFLRSTLAAIELTKEWQVRALETTDGHDQTEYNRILKGMYQPGVPGKHFRDLMPWPYLPTVLETESGTRPTDPRNDTTPLGNGHRAVAEHVRADMWATFNNHKKQGVRVAYWMWHGQIKVGILPMGEFLNGHLFFTRRLQEYSGVAPIAVHLTYQFGDTADYVYGKRQRLREHGIWLMEDDSYFTEGNFLVIKDAPEGYRHIVEQYAPVAKVCKPTDPVPTKCWHGAKLAEKSIADRAISPRDPEAFDDPARPHLEIQGWLRGVLRNGIVLAKKMNRILVLPVLECYCERHWWILDDCRIPAGPSQMPMPYKCPMDHIFEPADWFIAKVDFREPAFMSNPRVPEEVHNSSMRLSVVAAQGTPPLWDPKQRVLQMPRKSKFDDVVDQMESIRDRHGSEPRVVEIQAADLRDEFSLCVGTSSANTEKWNRKLRNILDGRLVEFCSKERNTLLGEVGPPLEAQGLDAKQGLNCSYPGKWPVTSNPVKWASMITQENRQAWIGDLLQSC